jgi:hypothetical protein
VLCESCPSIFRPPLTLKSTSTRCFIFQALSSRGRDRKRRRRECREEVGQYIRYLFLHEIHLHGPVGKSRGGKLHISSYVEYMYTCIHKWERERFMENATSLFIIYTHGLVRKLRAIRLCCCQTCQAEKDVTDLNESGSNNSLKG